MTLPLHRTDRRAEPAHADHTPVDHAPVGAASAGTGSRQSTAMRFALPLLTTCALLGLAGCQDRSSAPAEPATPAVQTPGAATKAGAAAKPAPPNPDEVQATAALAQYLKTGVPVRTVVRRTLQIPGRLEMNENLTARVGAPFTGRIMALTAVVGQTVKRGDVLAEVSSPDLSSAQLTFLKAHSANELAERAVERAKLLLAADVIGTAVLQRRENELTVARAEKRAATDQLRVLGLPMAVIQRLEGTGQLVASTPITATKSGTIVERKAAIGQVVDPTHELFTISSLDSIWAVADVPEQEARELRRGQRVHLDIPALRNGKRLGTIEYVADLVNPETRTIQVRMALSNPEREYKPAMLASMVLEGPEESHLVVPPGAIVREENRDHVFVALGNDRYVLRPVTLGMDHNSQRVVLTGLQEHDQIVTNGAFHLNNERKLRASGG